MRWVSAVLLSAMASLVIVAAQVVPANTPGSEDEAMAVCDLGVGLGVNIQPHRVSLDGFILCADDSSSARQRVRRVELLTGPNAGDCLDRLAAAARVLRSVSRIGLHHWWRHYSSANIVEGR